MSSDMNGTAPVEPNGTAGDTTGPVNRVKGRTKPAGGSFFAGLYALRDKSLPEATLIRKAGPDGMSYAVRIPVAAPLTTDAIADAAKEFGGRVRVSDPNSGKSSSWGVSGTKAAETVRTLDTTE